MSAATFTDHEPVDRGYKVICGWLPLVLGFKTLERGYTANQSQLPLVLDLGPFDGHNNES